METTYYQLMDVEVNAWAGDYPTLEEALTAVREWADQDGCLLYTSPSPRDS